MTTRMLSRSCWAPGLGLLCLALAGCGTAAPAAPVATPVASAVASVPVPVPLPVEPTEPTFADPAMARPSLVGSVVTVAPAKIVEDLDALSRRLELPMMFGKELLSMLSGMGLFGDKAQFDAVWDQLDKAKPFSVVWVLPPKSEVKGYCAALTFRDAAGARQTFEKMGTAGARRMGLSERRTPQGEVLWGGVKGRTLFVSGSPEALLLAGGLAEVVQSQPFAGQAVVNVLPPALIAASGKSRDALLAEAAESTSREIKTTPGFGSASSQRLATAFVRAGVKMALDSSVVRFVLDVGPKDGLLIQTETVPAASTGFAALAAQRSPLSFDLKLPVRDDSTAVSAFGNVRGWLAAIAKILEATGPAGQALRKQLDSYFAVTSDWSCVIDTTETDFAGLCSASLKPASTPKAALDAVVALTEAAQAWEGELYGKKLSPLKIKRSRDMVEIEKKLEQPDLKARAISKSLFGGETVKSAFKVKNGRLLMASGKEPRKTLARYGTGDELKRAPLVAAALSRSKGVEAMMSVDVVSMALRILGKTKDLPGAEVAMAAAAMPGLSEMKAPFLFTMRGGNSLVSDFRIPLGSLENVAKVVRGMFGAAGTAR